MSGWLVSEEELSAFIDGELSPARTEAVARAVAEDAALAARVAAFRRDRDALRAALSPAVEAAVPEAWLRRIEAAVKRPPADLPVAPPSLARRRPRGFAWAVAACLALMVAAGAMQLRPRAAGDALLAEALAARTGSLAVTAHFDAAALPDDAAQRSLLKRATGLPVRAPDLRRQGWRLAAIDVYRNAASLRYANTGGQRLFVFVRRSQGTPRFDILKRRADRICLWQDEVVAAVMMGEMSAGQMMRVAGAAYASLDL